MYRVRIAERDGRERRFRLLLFAAPPDRIHAEIVSSVGSTELIFDGGAGRLAVTLVREGLAFVGTADPESVEHVLGVRLSLGELVDHLYGGSAARPAGLAVTREAARAGELPVRWQVTGEERSVSLELKRLVPLGVPESDLGTGEPPPGMESRSLGELRLHPFSGDAEPPEAAGP
jgi:hypothetical protein